MARLRHLPRLLVLAIALGVAVSSAETADKAPASGSALQSVTWGDLRFATSPPRKVQIEGAKDPVESFDDQIPDKVRALQRQQVEIRGYMMPTELEGKNVRSFILVTSPAVCCYGQTPDINEYIVVRMSGKPALLLENTPIRVVGRLQIGDIYDHGYWTGIYALECSDVKL